MWGDEKFKNLSKPSPNARDLWIYLLTGRHTTCIPGLFQVGLATLAEDLEWKLSGTKKAFHEIWVAQKMLDVDEKTRLIWIPKAIEHNLPQNPNVVLGWRATWVDLPECPLKDNAKVFLQMFLDNYGKASRKSFGKAFEKVTAKALGNDCLNSESESESEIESDKEKRDKKESALPKGFCLTQELEDYARERGVADPQETFEHFLNHHQSKGSTFKDWSAAFRTWVCREKDFTKSKEGGIEGE